MSTLSNETSVAQLELDAASLDPRRAAEIYQQYGCLVVRGLMLPYVRRISEDIERSAAQAISLLDQAKKVDEGWLTPEGTLFIPAPPGFKRDRQIMVLGVNYTTSAAFFQSAFHAPLLDVLEQIIGPDIELYSGGQCLYKEPVGGHPKHLHQDSAYFEHRFDGPVAVLSYIVDTDLTNGALHVVPGSHTLGPLDHVDTFSHLGLDPAQWPWEKALPVTGSAGDAIFFHYRTVHGSKENHSNASRPVFIHRYRRPDDYVTVGGTTVEKRRAAEKNAASVRNEPPGLMVRGFRRYDPRT